MHAEPAPALDRGVIPARERRGPGPVALGLGIAYAPMFVPALVRWAGGDLPGSGPASAICLNWAVVGVLLGYVRFVERRPLSSLLLTRPRPGDLRWAALLCGCTLGYGWLVSLVVPQPINAGVATITALSVPTVLALVVTVAITEEITFRGYPVERIAELVGRRWPAVAISAVVFAAPHVLFFDWTWLVYQGPAAAAIYVLYVWRRNLWACMLLHLLGNAPILIPTVLG